MFGFINVITLRHFGKLVISVCGRSAIWLPNYPEEGGVGGGERWCLFIYQILCFNIAILLFVCWCY